MERLFALPLRVVHESRARADLRVERQKSRGKSNVRVDPEVEAQPSVFDSENRFPFRFRLHLDKSVNRSIKLKDNH